MKTNRVAGNDSIPVTGGFSLTRLDPSDAESLVKYLNHHEFHNATCSIPYPYTLNAAKTFISSVLAYEKANRIRRDWAIREPGGEQIGGIGLLYNYGLNAHRTEFGYWLAKPWWNRGIMTSVLRCFSEYIFTTRNIVRLEAIVFSTNPASCKVLRKAGFSEEGFLRKAYKKGDEYVDAHLFGLVKD